MPESENWKTYPTLDKDVIDALCQVLEDSAAEVVDEYLVDTPALAEKARAALADRNDEKLADIVHQIKSSSGALGGLRVQKLAAHVEQQAQQQATNPEDCNVLFDAIRELLASLKTYREHLNG